MDENDEMRQALSTLFDSGMGNLERMGFPEQLISLAKKQKEIVIKKAIDRGEYLNKDQALKYARVGFPDSYFNFWLSMLISSFKFPKFFLHLLVGDKPMG